MMDRLMKTMYLYFYRKPSMFEIKYSIKAGTNIERLFKNDGTRTFVENYAVFGSELYFKFLEIKSKEAREEWGREAVYHTRPLKRRK
jgi:hypothetical protein